MVPITAVTLWGSSLSVHPLTTTTKGTRNYVGSPPECRLIILVLDLLQAGLPSTLRVARETPSFPILLITKTDSFLVRLFPQYPVPEDSLLILF